MCNSQMPEAIKMEMIGTLRIGFWIFSCIFLNFSQILKECDQQKRSALHNEVCGASLCDSKGRSEAVSSCYESNQ